MTVRDHDRGARKLKTALEELADNVTIKVGIHRDDGAVIIDEESGLTLAGLAAIHEFGAPADGIPARGWLRGAIDSARGEIERNLASAAGIVVQRKKRVAVAFREVGDKVARQKIAAGIATLAPIAPETAARKGSSAVLRDTGFFVSRIHARVVRGRKARSEAAV